MLFPIDKSSSQGKLRLLYEAAPLTFIAEQAGGAGSTGEENILDVVPQDLHQRVALYIGNKSDVVACEEFLAGKRKL
jgi:fructose-1,6-bisphosphatase I